MNARRVVALAIAGGSLFVSAIAGADEPSQAPVSTPPPAPVSFAITAGEGGAWKLRVENTGELPVRVAADVALLTLEVEPPPTEKKRGVRGPVAVRCAFGRGSRPDNDDDSALVIPGKKSWSATFDPRRLCFSARDRAALVAGAKVTAHFGFPEGKRPRGAKPGAPPPAPVSPFAVTPVGAAFGKLSPLKELSATPFTIAPSSVPAPPAGPKIAAEDTRLELGITPFVDSERGRAIDARITLANRSARNVALLFRSSTITFDVDGPKGHVACDRPPKAGTPIRELYTRLAPGGRTAISLLIDAKCPPGTFVAPGIYRVRALLDTREADGFEAGLTTFNGEVTGGEAIVRVREWQNDGARVKPALD